ncbi:MAG: DegV family protein [Dehalococcoidales bacterium]|nr:DegV family protein [Dehalococcoidales bacterium]
MTVKIITDSMADLPVDLIKKHNITVIPVNVLFGMDCYRDGVDMTTEQFYDKLVASKTIPTTAVPSLGTFVDIFKKVLEEADELLVLTISHKLSGTYDTACRAAEMVKSSKPIKVIDTLHVIMGEGLVTITAAIAAQTGAKLDDLVKLVNNSIPRIEERMAFDTLDYLKKGGRIGSAQAFLGSILKLNPVLRLRNGEVFPISRERSRAKAIESLYNFVLEFSNVEAIAVEDATTPEEADKLARRLKLMYPDAPIYRSKVGAVMGTHVGPRIIAVSVLGDKK